MPKGFLFKEIKSFIEEESNSGCVLLDNEYKGSVSPLNIRCSCGEPFETTFSSFKNFNKRQCNKCGFRIRANKRMHDYEAVKRI